MNLKNQRKLAARILNVGKTRIWFDPNRLTEIKEAITGKDIGSLIKDKAVQAKPKVGVSRGRARKLHEQKKKGRRKGVGSRKGKATARSNPKRGWMNRVRMQRNFLRNLKDKKYIDNSIYRMLYRKIKGGFFRSKRHLKLYLDEANLIQRDKK